MIFLPVVERELRVASRKRSTFWIRIAAALVALLIGIGFLVMVAASSLLFRPPAMGQILFNVLTWLSLAGALFAGFFFTSDCLSEEKREGTLGFLFLTDLRGYDVVLGKLLATSLRSFYTLFSVLPVLGITLLMGGVTGAEFWKTSLALMNALFLSLAAGMFVSSISRDPQKAMGATLSLLVLISALGPAVDALFSRIITLRPTASISSPVYLFVTAGWNTRSPFWPALLVNQLIAWILLVLSCVLLPRTWQQKATKSSTTAESWGRWWKYGGAKRRLRLRAKLMSVNPVAWLACRERWQAVSFWVIAIIAAGALAAFLFNNQQFIWFVWSYLASALNLMLYLGVAAQSNRFFVEAQRSGLTELLLGTPLTVKDIVQGHWRATLRMFAIPLVVCLAVQLVGTTVAQQNTFRQFAAATTAATAGTTPNTNVASTNVTSGPVSTTIPASSANNAVSFSLTSLSSLEGFLPILSAAMTTLTTLANLMALCWFGMWMGVTSKNSNLATLKTIAFVQIVPWFAITFASGIATALLIMPQIFTGGMSGSFSFAWYQILSVAVTTILCVLKDAAFVVWARKKLYSDLRARSTRAILPIHPQLPPLPSLPGTPAGSAPPSINYS